MKQLTMFSPPEISSLAGIFERAADEWGFNCGPGAICGAASLYPEMVRPHLGKFEQRQRRYMSPSDMWSALRSVGVEFRALAVDGWLKRQCWPRSNGVCRLQWGGPWCAKGRPPAAAYRHTHWIAARRNAYDRSIWVFDVNNLVGAGVVCESGWLPLATWEAGVLPTLLPLRGDGRWWLTHRAELWRKT